VEVYCQGTRDNLKKFIEKLPKSDYNEKLHEYLVLLENRIEKINQEFTEGSFPQQLLKALADDEDAMQMAYELIMGVRK